MDDETQTLQRDRPARREVGSDTQSSSSQFVRDKMSGGIVKDVNEVRSLIESVSRSNRKVIFEL